MTDSKKAGGESPRPLVGVVADERSLDSYRWHAAPAVYLEALTRIAGAAPVIIPPMGCDANVSRYLGLLDGVLLTGSRSNVHPERYGTPATAAHEPFDAAPDATSLAFLREALARGLPLFAICRGMQELNVALGGTLQAELHLQPGRLAHSAPESDDQDERFRIRHSVRLASGGRLEAMLGCGRIEVNSVHRQGIDRLADGLDVEATAEDGTIEAVRVRDARSFALGVQWHPEYWAESDEPSRRLFEAFGTALRSGGDLHAAAE